MEKPVITWSVVLSFYQAVRTFFTSKEHLVLGGDFISLIGQQSCATKALLIIKKTTEKHLVLVSENAVTAKQTDDLVDALPLLFNSYPCVRLNAEELERVRHLIGRGASLTLIDGVHFAVELDDDTSLYFILLRDEEAGAYSEQEFKEVSDMAGLMEQLAGLSQSIADSETLKEQIKLRQKRQTIWLESLAWLNDFAASQFTGADLENFYTTASFQLKLLVSADMEVAFRVDKANQCLVYITQEDEQARFNGVLGVVEKMVASGGLIKKSHHRLAHRHQNLIDRVNFSDLMLFPLFLKSDLQMVLCVGRQEGEFDVHEETVFSLFSEGVEHIMERWNFRLSIEKKNQLLQQEKKEQQKLIKQLQDAQEHMIQQEKMASIGQLAAGVAHEINNPVGYVNSNINSLGRYIKDLFDLLAIYHKLENSVPDDDPLANEAKALKDAIDFEFVREDMQDLVKESKEGVLRVTQIVKDLKDFSHIDEAEWQWADLVSGINSTLNIVRNELKYKAEIKLELDELPKVECVPSQINQVVMNMLVNAGHAIEESGVISLGARQLDEDWVVITVGDTGKGIDADNIAKLFDPFFTTKPMGKGTGLGLSLSYSIVEKHGGDISVESAPGVGTTFTVRLPIKQQERKAE